MDLLIPALLIVIAALSALGFGGIGYLTGASRDRFVRKFVPVAVFLGALGAMVIAVSEIRLGHSGSFWAFAWMYGTWTIGLALGRSTWRNARSD